MILRVEAWNCRGSIVFPPSEIFKKPEPLWSASHGGESDRELSHADVLDLAQRGLLLSYVLRINGKPCSLAIGTLFRDTHCHAFFPARSKTRSFFAGDNRSLVASHMFHVWLPDRTKRMMRI